MSQKFNKRIFTVKEFFRSMDLAMGSLGKYFMAGRRNIIAYDFKERIMLAVTEVNGCQACSYWHSKEALKAGLSREEINSLCAGNLQSVPEDEAIAILFAQHYAETGGYPEKHAWDRVVQHYGHSKSEYILAVVRVIMMGNAQGIAVGAFKNRLKGDPAEKSSLSKELGVMVGSFLFFPMLVIKNLMLGQRDAAQAITFS